MKFGYLILALSLIISQTYGNTQCDAQTCHNMFWQSQKTKKDEYCRDVFLAIKIIKYFIAGYGLAVISAKVGLSLSGFSSIGPVAGSIAAAWQSAWGIGSVFSFFQSISMGLLGSLGSMFTVAVVPSAIVAIMGGLGIVGYNMYKGENIIECVFVK